MLCRELEQFLLFLSSWEILSLLQPPTPRLHQSGFTAVVRAVPAPYQPETSYLGRAGGQKPSHHTVTWAGNTMHLVGDARFYLLKPFYCRNSEGGDGSRCRWRVKSSQLHAEQQGAPSEHSDFTLSEVVFHKHGVLRFFPPTSAAIMSYNW